MRVVASAPTRIDLAGGTLDIWPLYLFHEGAQTLNAAISLRAHVEVESRSDGRLALESVDTNRSIDVTHWSELRGHRELTLLSRLAYFFRAENLTLRTRGESPAGAGIAGSSALNVAVCGALARWAGTTLIPEDLLQIAMNVEAQAIAVPTGVQDYRPALFGGIASVELGVNGVRRVDLDVDPQELERRIVLAYTGIPRRSGTNNWEITKRHIDGDRYIFDCFDAITRIAAKMRTALTDANWSEVARLVSREWDVRKKLAPGVTTPAIDDLITAARAAGASAAKVCGAGGGGCLFCFAEPDAVPAVRAALTRGGARVLDYQIEMEGLRVETREE